jgi:hypothetical protein
LGANLGKQRAEEPLEEWLRKENFSRRGKRTGKAASEPYGPDRTGLLLAGIIKQKLNRLALV